MRKPRRPFVGIRYVPHCFSLIRKHWTQGENGAWIHKSVTVPPSVRKLLPWRAVVFGSPGFITISGCEHWVIRYRSGIIKIGCCQHTLPVWKRKYESIARYHLVPHKEVLMCKLLVRCILKMRHNERKDEMSIP